MDQLDRISLISRQAESKSICNITDSPESIRENSSALILNQIKRQILSVTEALPQSPVNHRMARQFSHRESKPTSPEGATHPNSHCRNSGKPPGPFGLENNGKLTLEGLRYNPALLASAANTLVFQTTDVARIVSATVQQAQMNRLSTHLLQGETINKMFNFLDTAAKQKGMQLLIKKSVDLFLTEL